MPVLCPMPRLPHLRCAYDGTHSASRNVANDIFQGMAGAEWPCHVALQNSPAWCEGSVDMPNVLSDIAALKKVNQRLT